MLTCYLTELDGGDPCIPSILIAIKATMAQIILDGLLVELLINARFPGGTDDLIARWDASGSGLNPSTVYRWKQGGLPRTGVDLLRLSSLLDVDPFCLLTFDRGSPQLAVDALLSWAQSNQWNRFGFFRDFFGRQRDWPPTELAKKHYKRDWNENSFFHHPSKKENRYAVVQLNSSCKNTEVFPQTFHFAYRQSEQYAGRWLNFGFVVVHKGTVRLQHINGQRCSYSAPTTAAARVETFFGPNAAEFKVASLHPFTLCVDPAEEQTGPSVRFEA